MTLELYTGEELIQKATTRDLELLTELWNSRWEPNKVSPNLMKRRITSGETIIVGYEGKIPKALLETVLIFYDTITIPEDATFDHLTNNGTWANLPYRTGKNEILLLVDVSAEGKGNGAELITKSLDYLAQHTSLEHIFTVTPEVLKIRQWHHSLGAEETDFVVQKARPGYRGSLKFVLPTDNPENVRGMSYSKKVLSLRNLLSI
ncbi:MAG: hypothetical protein KKA62_05795 [Nanoarchaeota archaeon]|nr:hypothetical protein [Nanoarchaeota archaeon]MBU1643845.1 hypothetical protein [Nanoarchaeota archaeon]MBU1977437.1 hypothetical protein [Nanoarchaeota archaeon]